MNDQPTSSGSRWEPTDQTDQPGQPVAPAERVYDGPTYAGPSYATPRGRMPGRSRAIIAGAAVGLLGVGGLGGYALGATTAGGERGDGDSLVDVNGRFGGSDRHGDGGVDSRVPPGFDQRRQGQLPPGLGQDGTLPDFDGDDEDGTGDGTDSGSRT